MKLYSKTEKVLWHFFIFNVLLILAVTFLCLIASCKTNKVAEKSSQSSWSKTEHRSDISDERRISELFAHKSISFDSIKIIIERSLSLPLSEHIAGVRTDSVPGNPMRAEQGIEKIAVVAYSTKMESVSASVDSTSLISRHDSQSKQDSAASSSSYIDIESAAVFEPPDMTKTLIWIGVSLAVIAIIVCLIRKIIARKR